MNVTSDADADVDANASFDANAAVLTRHQRRLVSLWARFSFVVVVVAVSFAGHSHIISALISLHRVSGTTVQVAGSCTLCYAQYFQTSATNDSNAFAS